MPAAPISPKPWLRHYDAGVAPTLAPYPTRLIFDYLTDSARDRPDHPALLFKGRSISCLELDRLSDAFAAALAQLGVRKGERVALLMPNSPQFVIAEIGAWKAGAIVVPLNPLHTEHELEGPLAESGATTCVVLTRFYNRIKACQPRTHLVRVIATNIKEYLPPALRLLFTLLKEKREGHRITLAAGDRWFADLLASHEGAPRPDIAVSPTDPAVLLMSGGTTGTPKLVLGLHHSLVEAGTQLRDWLKSACHEWTDTFLLPLPLFHVYGVGVLALSFIGHHPLAIVPNPRDIDDLLQTIVRVRPAFFCAVPTLFIAILNHRKVVNRQVDFSSIKLCFSGAAALMADTKLRFEVLTGGRIVEGYSLSEAFMACAVNPVSGPNKIGTVGMPLPDVELAIVDAEAGDRILPIGEEGEVILRAPEIMTGYWQNPRETAAALRRHDEGGPWLHTGDLGVLDEDGYLTLIDRKKDLIKTSGYQAWPREIEEVIASHPAVAEVGVAGVPDAIRGEIVMAWVVLREGQPLDETELRTYCRENLAPYKVPSRVKFRRDLPKTMVGKVLRRALVADEIGSSDSGAD